MARKLNGPKVRTKRLDAGLTQKTCAGSVGISRAYLCNLEHGRKNGTPALQVRLADVLGVEVSEITEPDPAEAAA